jgi:autotransporter-associated beta strand protein
VLTGTSANSFSISGTGSGGVRPATVASSLLLEHHTTGIFNISAPLLDNGVSGLIKNGAGTVVLSGANTYTGATSLNDGTTRFAGAMGPTTITINNAAVGQVGFGDCIEFGQLRGVWSVEHRVVSTQRQFCDNRYYNA